MFLAPWMIAVIALMAGIAYLHGYFRGRYIGFHTGAFHMMVKLDQHKFIDVREDGMMKSGTIQHYVDYKTVKNS